MDMKESWYKSSVLSLLMRLLCYTKLNIHRIPSINKNNRNRRPLRRILVRFRVIFLLIFLVWLYFKFLTFNSYSNKLEQTSLTTTNSPTDSHCPTCDISSKFKDTYPSMLNDSLSFKIDQQFPTIARVLYLILCEDQNEVDEYLKFFPSYTADVMFLCWKNNCNNKSFTKLSPLYVAPWSGASSNDQTFIHFDSKVNYTKVEPRVFIINEKELDLRQKTTWTTARNILLENALIEERRQEWRWAYFTFTDGDVQLNCSFAVPFLDKNRPEGDGIVFAKQFYSLTNNTFNNDKCFILFDVFLLSSSPAIGVVGGMITASLFDNLLAQIVYNIDAMFNALHRDALQFILPYCPRYDKQTWWASQAILIYRALCLYGHVIQLNIIEVSRQKHRSYPQVGDPYRVALNMRIVPQSLLQLQRYMGRTRTVSPLVLQHYGGWSLRVTNNECRNHHTYSDRATCQVSGRKNQVK